MCTYPLSLWSSTHPHGHFGRFLFSKMNKPKISIRIDSEWLAERLTERFGMTGSIGPSDLWWYLWCYRWCYLWCYLWCYWWSDTWCASWRSWEQLSDMCVERWIEGRIKGGSKAGSIDGSTGSVMHKASAWLADPRAATCGSPCGSPCGSKCGSTRSDIWIESEGLL
jgi:hypothetical protein